MFDFSPATPQDICRVESIAEHVKRDKGLDGNGVGIPGTNRHKDRLPLLMEADDSPVAGPHARQHRPFLAGFITCNASAQRVKTQLVGCEFVSYVGPTGTCHRQ